ncbi:MAG TPA: hypothetical protein VGF14_02320 [Alphaproteobacteria bacterium]
MKPKHIAWAVGTFFLTLQGCTENKNYEQDAKIFTMDEDFLKSSKGEPAHIYELSVPQGNAPTIQIVYKYTEDQKKIRTSLFVCDEDLNDRFDVFETKSGSCYIEDIANQIESTLSVDQDEIIYNTRYNSGPVTENRTQDKEKADKKLREMINETLYGILPDHSRTVLASNIARP